MFAHANQADEDLGVAARPTENITADNANVDTQHATMVSNTKRRIRAAGKCAGNSVRRQNTTLAQHVAGIAIAIALMRSKFGSVERCNVSAPQPLAAPTKAMVEK